MAAASSARVILRYDRETDKQAFLDTFGDAFHINCYRSDAEAKTDLSMTGQEPQALVMLVPSADQVLGSDLLAAATQAGCFRILISDSFALDEIIHLLDNHIIDRCYPQPWDSHRLRSDLFTATMSVASHSYTSQTPTHAEGKPLVLIVDDETAATKYLSKHLMRLQDNFEVRCAASADEALDVLLNEGSRIAVMMTDQRMPGMKGLQLITELKQSYPHITRILTSAYGELDVALGAVNQGRIYRYEKKPWNASQLLPVLEDAIAQHRKLRKEVEASRCAASSAFETSRRQRRQALIEALSGPGFPAITSPDLAERFLNDLEQITTLAPGAAHRRASAPDDLTSALVRGLRHELSAYLSPDQGMTLLKGHSVPTSVADALQVLLGASGLGEDSLIITNSTTGLSIRTSPDQPLRMYSHLLSPLAGVSNPLVQQQGALLALYLWAEKLGAECQVSGGQQSFSLDLLLPADTNGEASQREI